MGDEMPTARNTPAESPIEPSAAPSPIEPPAAAQPAASDDDKAKAEAAATAELQAHPHKGQFVSYTGPKQIAANADELRKRPPRLGEGTTAEITQVQWGQHGIDAKRTHTWNLANNWRLPATQFTTEQIDYLLTNSKRFELVNSDGEKVATEQ
jgi:hypothetical protein